MGYLCQGQPALEASSEVPAIAPATGLWESPSSSSYSTFLWILSGVVAVLTLVIGILAIVIIKARKDKRIMYPCGGKG